MSSFDEYACRQNKSYFSSCIVTMNQLWLTVEDHVDDHVDDHVGRSFHQAFLLE